MHCFLPRATLGEQEQVFFLFEKEKLVLFLRFFHTVLIFISFKIYRNFSFRKTVRITSEFGESELFSFAPARVTIKFKKTL